MERYKERLQLEIIRNYLENIQERKTETEVKVIEKENKEKL